MTTNDRAVGARQVTYLTLIGVFLSAFGLVARGGKRRGQDMHVGAMDLAMLGVASYRIGRLTAYDRVTQPLREPFTETEPADGAGETVVAQGTGGRKALGELLSCPTCIGTWAAAALVYGLQFMPAPTRLFLAIMSATGVAELLDAATEALSWTGNAARTRAKLTSSVDVHFSGWRGSAAGEFQNQGGDPVATGEKWTVTRVTSLVQNHHDRYHSPAVCRRRCGGSSR